ncbi:MAG: hypothetical protein JXB30_05795 [Anaerolineae bacterium]|nr:hypothetical protein [Anaerolineae bacterium]
MMPPNKMTEEAIQDLLEHVKVRVDPAFNKALQAQLQARAQELRDASTASSQPHRSFRDTVRYREAPAHASAEQTPLPQRRLNTLAMLSSAVFGIAILAFFFMVIVRPQFSDPATAPIATEETAIPTTGQTLASPAGVTLTGKAVELEPTVAHITTLTPIPIGTATPMPSLTPPPVPVTDIEVTCSWTRVSGYVEASVPYMRLTVSLSSPTIQEIGSGIVAVQPDGSYSVLVTYSALPAGTHLIGAYGEWDGTTWLRPATTFGADCQSGDATPTPTPISIPTSTPLLTPTPTPILATSTPLTINSVQFWPDVSMLDRYTTVDFGARINFESSIVTRARLLAFLTYQGESTPGTSACISQQMPGRGSELFWSTGTSTERTPGTNNFEQSYVYDNAAPNDATHLVMWLILTDTNDQAIACRQKIIELSAVSP